MEDNVRKRMHMYEWVTLLYSRKWTEYYKPTIMEKIKIIKKKKRKKSNRDLRVPREVRI